MKMIWNREWPHWMVLGTMFSLALWRWPLTGAQVPMRWASDGHVTRYGGRFEGLLLLPFLSLGIYALLLTLPRFDPGRANYVQFSKPYNTIRFVVLLSLFVPYGAILLVTAGHKMNVPSLQLSFVGVVIFVLGAVMGKMRPNWFVGVRTPWTLSSKTSWVKTHRVGGWTFLAMGAVQIVAGIALPPSSALPLMKLMLLSVSLGLIAYSYLVWRDADDKIPPAGTLPADDFDA